MNQILLPIRDVATELGISSSTLRRWEREGVLPFRPRRDAVGRRVYTIPQVNQLRRLLRERHQNTAPVGHNR